MKNNFSISEAIKFGWSKFKSNWKFWIIIFCLVFGINANSGLGLNFPKFNNIFSPSDNTLSPVAPQYSKVVIPANDINKVVLGAKDEISKSSPSIVEIILIAVGVIYGIGTTIGVIFLVLLTAAARSIIQIGNIHLAIDAARGNTLDYKTLLSDVSVKKVLRLWWLYILQSLIITGGLILFIIPGLYWALKYFFAPYLLIDKNVSAIESLKLSAKLTKGVKIKLVLFILCSFLVFLVGFLFFLVGVAPALLVIALATAFIYVSLDKQVSQAADTTQS